MYIDLVNYLVYIWLLIRSNLMPSGLQQMPRYPALGALEVPPAPYVLSKYIQKLNT
jgi:hypothetical protein